MSVLSHVFLKEEGENIKDVDSGQRKLYNAVVLDQKLFLAFLENVREAKQNQKKRIKNGRKKEAATPSQIYADFSQVDYFTNGEMLELHFKNGQRFRSLFKFLIDYKIRIVHPEEDLKFLSLKTKEYSERVQTEEDEEDEEEDKYEEDEEEKKKDEDAKENENEKENEKNEDANEGGDQSPNFSYLEKGGYMEDERAESFEQAVKGINLDILFEIPSPRTVCESCIDKKRKLEELYQQVLDQKALIEEVEQRSNELILEKERRIVQLEEEINEKKLLLEATVQLSPPKMKIQRVRHDGTPNRAIRAVFNRWRNTMLSKSSDVLFAKNILSATEKPEYLGIVHTNCWNELKQIEDNLRVQGNLLNIFEEEENTQKKTKRLKTT